MNEKLYRSNQNKILGGVCGGLAEYFGIDPIFVRIFFMLWVILGSWGVGIYIILWLVIPPAQYDDPDFQLHDLGDRFQLAIQDLRQLFRNPSSELLTYGGIALVGVGISQLIRSLGWDWTIYWNSTLVWAVLLIGGGAFILIRTYTKKK